MKPSQQQENIKRMAGTDALGRREGGRD